MDSLTSSFLNLFKHGLHSTQTKLRRAIEARQNAEALVIAAKAEAARHNRNLDSLATSVRQQGGNPDLSLEVISTRNQRYAAEFDVRRAQAVLVEAQATEQAAMIDVNDIGASLKADEDRVRMQEEEARLRQEAEQKRQEEEERQRSRIAERKRREREARLKHQEEAERRLRYEAQRICRELYENVKREEDERERQRSNERIQQERVEYIRQARERLRRQEEKDRQDRERAERKHQDERKHRARPIQSSSQQTRQAQQRQIEAWYKSTETGFERYADLRIFPVPPTLFRCQEEKCQLEPFALGVCPCNVNEVFRRYMAKRPGHSVRKESFRWHPDRFSPCPEAYREVFKSMASEIFIVLGSGIDGKTDERA